MQLVVGATLLGLTTVFVIAAAVVLVRGRRHHRNDRLPTSVTGPVLGLSLLALVTGVYGFIAFFGITSGIGVTTNLG